MAGDANVLLGFDFGTKRIGVAVGNAITGNAQALTTLHYSNAGGGPDWQGLTRIVAEWRPGGLVVGLPLANDGSSQPMTENAQEFMRQLGEHFDIPVHAMDERFSTIEAMERLRTARASGSRGKRLAKGDSDSMAAQVILEGWLANGGAS
ncbi:Holliday junction resolvase RuvX [uncultured Salinisphaera sp.]|uniref:Holliday junction resolvase RuvX n=1 Tax=uncultured Salinisphaera sp. TaxID=359372 RepID=UPI0032B231C8